MKSIILRVSHRARFSTVRVFRPLFERWGGGLPQRFYHNFVTIFRQLNTLRPVWHIKLIIRAPGSKPFLYQLRLQIGDCILIQCISHSAERYTSSVMDNLHGNGTQFNVSYRCQFTDVGNALRFVIHPFNYHGLSSLWYYGWYYPRAFSEQVGRNHDTQDNAEAETDIDQASRVRDASENAVAIRADGKPDANQTGCQKQVSGFHTTKIPKM